LSSITGEGSYVDSARYRLAIAVQSRSVSTCSAAFLDLVLVPQRAVLLREEHELAVPHARVPPRVLEEQERVQAVHLGLVRHERREDEDEPQRLRAQVAADGRPVAGVEDEIDHAQRRREPFREQPVGRDAERDAGVADLPLRTHETLRHRRCRDEEGPRDLVRLQPAEEAERQRHLRLECERGVAAEEDQLEPLVGYHAVLRRRELLEPREQLGLPPLTADAVDGAVPGDSDEPSGGARRRAVTGPALHCGCDGILQGVLGEGGIAEDADERGEHTAVLGAEDLREIRYASTLAWRMTMGRTSMWP
jgi:hypothetical protein